MPNLKPCPFCGEKDRLALNKCETDFPYRVECRMCGCEGPNDIDEDEATWLWNNREYPESGHLKAVA